MTRGLLFVFVFASACGVGDPLRLDEPIFVHDGVFRAGALPGTAPVPDGEMPPTGVPLVTSFETTSAIFTDGQLDRHITGRTSEDAYAIAIEMRGLGTGYFTLPVGATDPGFAGERDFDVELDVGNRIPSGLQHLSIVAIDASGHAGPRQDSEICVVDGAVPGDFSVCDPTLTPPAAAIVLRWDTESDLDLVVTTPDGQRVDARHPLTTSASDPAVGRFVRDSNAGCDIDGRNEEVVVWNEVPVDAGAFLVGVDLFAACNTAGAHFEVTILERQTRDDGTFVLAVTETRSGQLLAIQADEGLRPPLYVTFVSF